MSQSSPFRLAEEARSQQAEAPTGLPSVELQQLWFSLQKREWSSLVLVPADAQTSALDFGQPLYEVGRLALGEQLKLVDARSLKLTETAPLILEMTGAGPARPGAVRPDRVMVLVDSVLSRPSGIPVALAADLAVLCIELGRSSLPDARSTLQILGQQRFAGCLTIAASRR